MKAIVTKTLRTQNPLIKIAKIGSYVYMADKKLRLYFLSLIGEKNMSQNLECSVDEKYHPSICFSPSNNKICYAKPNSFELNISKLEKGVFGVEKSVSWHEKEIEACAFSLDGRFLSSGGCDGRVFIYHAGTLNVVKSFKRKPDYINRVKFSEDSKFFVYTCFDKTIEVFDLYRCDFSFQSKTISVIEELKFAHNGLYIGMRDGQFGFIYDKKIDIFKENASFWITSFEITPDGNYAVVCGKSDRMVIYDLQTKEIALKVALSNNSGVSHIKFIDEDLYISYNDCVLEVVAFYKYFKESDSAISQRDYKTLCLNFKDNPFLRFKNGFLKAIDDGWRMLQEDILSLLLQGKPQGAIKLAEPFMIDDAKKTEFSFLMGKLPEIGKFIEAVDGNEIKKAYMLCEKFQYLKKLYHYEKIESIWKKDFYKAKKILETNPKHNKQKALEILSDYQQIESKKSLTVTLINNVDKFVEAENYIKNKDFKAYFALCDLNSFLKDTELYEKTLNFGASMLEKAIAYEYAKDYSQALLTLKLLSDFPNIGNSAKDLINNIKIKHAFISTVESGDIKKAFALVNNYLEHTEEFATVVKKYEEVLMKAQVEAFNGNEIEVLRLVSSLEGISFYSQRLKNIKKCCLMSTICKTFGGLKTSDRESKIKTYIKLFGPDEQLEKLCTNFNLVSPFNEDYWK